MLQGREGESMDDDGIFKDGRDSSDESSSVRGGSCKSSSASA